MDFASLTLVCVATCFLLLWWYRRPKNSPPGPRGMPVFGVIPLFDKFPEYALAKWTKIYGPIMSVRMGREDWIVLNDFESITQAFIRQNKVFSGRPIDSFTKKWNQGCGITLIDYGELWKSQRKFGISALRRHGFGGRNMENHILDELNHVNDYIKAENGKAFDISDLLNKATANNISVLVMGQRFEYDDPRFKTMILKLANMLLDLSNSVVFQMMYFMPSLTCIPPFSTLEKNILHGVRLLLESLDEIIVEHKVTFEKENLRDFIDEFLKHREKKFFSNLQLLYYVRDLFESGSLTTSKTLYWTLLCFLHYPEAQTKLREEVANVVGCSGSLNWSHKSKMPYVNAFIEESMRYRTFLPLGVPHKTNKDTEINGYFIPNNTPVMANIWAVHNDPEYWNEPEKFKPERFIDDEGRFNKSDHVIPFSIGPRSCLGEQLARMQMFLYVTTMVQKFEFIPDSAATKLPEINDGTKIDAFMPFPYKLVAKQL